MDDIHLEQVRSLMSQITDLMEDLWIERQGLRSVLAHHGFSPEQFLEIEKAAKEDDDLRNQARLAFVPILGATPLGRQQSEPSGRTMAVC